MMNPVYVDERAPLTAYERSAVLKRLSQIAVALGHPRRTTSQAVVLLRERAELERKLGDPLDNQQV
jgi:hypothetical protein